MKPYIPAFLFVLGAILVGVGIMFHYKEKKDYGEYFFFGALAIVWGIYWS